jgi:hypothetical protein
MLSHYPHFARAPKQREPVSDRWFDLAEGVVAILPIDAFDETFADRDYHPIEFSS